METTEANADGEQTVAETNTQTRKTGQKDKPL